MPRKAIGKKTGLVPRTWSGREKEKNRENRDDDRITRSRKLLHFAGLNKRQRSDIRDKEYIPVAAKTTQQKRRCGPGRRLYAQPKQPEQASRRR